MKAFFQYQFLTNMHKPNPHKGSPHHLCIRIWQLSSRGYVDKWKHSWKYIRQEFLQLQPFLIKMIELWRPWGQTGSIYCVCIKNKTFLKQSWANSLWKRCHWHSIVTFQSAALYSRIAQSLKDEVQVLWWPSFQAT